MKQFLIRYTVRDGEHEYGQLAWIAARTEQSAEQKANKILQKGGYVGDYRIYEIESVRSVTQAQLNVIKDLGLAYEL